MKYMHYVIKDVEKDYFFFKKISLSSLNSMWNTSQRCSIIIGYAIDKIINRWAK